MKLSKNPRSIIVLTDRYILLVFAQIGTQYLNLVISISIYDINSIS